MATSSRMNWPYPNAGQDPWYEAFESFVEASDASSFAAFENANLFVFGGGPFTFTGVLGTVSWTDPLYVTTAATNIPQVVSAPSNTITLADGEVAYVKVVRNTVAPTSLPLLTASALPANDRDSALVIFARFGSVIQFRNGANILDGETKAVFESSSGTVTSVTAGDGLSGGVITTSGTISLPDTSVAPGVYTNPTVTVDAKGRVTAAASGTGPTSLSVVYPIQSTGGINPILSLGTVDAARGGTGLTSYTIGDLVYASGATTMARLSDIASGNVLLSGGLGAPPSYGKVGLGTHVSGVLLPSNGGTGQSSYTVGDIVYAAGSATLSALADVATGNVLLSGGVGVAPAYGKVGLTTHVDGTLAATNGGTGYASYATGDLLYAANTSALGKLAAAASGNVLLSGATPSWGKVALASAVSGILPVANGGTGLNSSLASNGQLLIGTGAGFSLATLTQGNGMVITNGSGTITVATNAVSTNTVSTIVTRDASGNFAAGTITATTFSGALSGTATNATNVGVTNDTTTNAVRYPTFVAATSGNDNIEVASTKLTFNPASGVLAATTFSGSGASLTSIPQSGVTNLTTDLAARPTGSGTNGQVAYFTGTSTITSEGGLTWDATNNRLGIGGATSAANLEIYGGTLGSVAGNSLELARIGNYTSNYSYLRVFSRRASAGSDWTTAPTRIQQSVDVTDMAYMEFNPPGGTFGLAFGTASSEYLRILNGGNVGIGTTNPARPLQVGNESGQQIVRIAGGSSGAAGGSALYLGAGTSDIFAVGHYSAVMGGAYNDTFTLYAASGRNTVFLGGGNVGVGTATPGYKLDVNGDVNTPLSNGSRIGFLVGDAFASNGIFAANYGLTLGPAGNYTVGLSGWAGLALYTSSLERLRIDSGGNVGIGETPNTRLNVKGGTTWLRNFNGTAAAPTEAFDWPVPALNIASYGDYTLQTMLAFTLPNDGNYDTGFTTWNFKLAQTASSTTSAGVTGLQLGGPGYLALLPLGGVGIGNLSANSYKLSVTGVSVGTAAGTASLWPPGTAQGQRSSLSFFSTFQATGDNGPRRTADIIAGYNGGAWGTEYLSFNVGNATDSQFVTTERLRISTTGAVSIPSTGSLGVGSGTWTTNGSDIFLNTNGSSTIYLRPGGAGSSNWEYRASGLSSYHRWTGAAGAQLLLLDASKLDVATSIRIPGATATDNASPGLVYALSDDFLYNTYYLNQYGVGFHVPSGAAGRGVYVSGYYGVDLFTSGTARLSIAQGGRIAIGSNSFASASAGATAYGITIAPTNATAAGMAMHWNLSGGDGETDFIGYGQGGGGGYAWYNFANPSGSGNWNQTGAPTLLLKLTSAGLLNTRATNENLRMEGTDPWASFYQAGVRKGWFGYGSGAGTTTFSITTETTNGSLGYNANGLGAHIFNRRLIPTADNSYDLGGVSPQRWRTVYAGTGTINTSDAREKKDVATSDLGLAFIEALHPVSYRFKVGQNKVEAQPDGTDKITPQPGVRPHYGFIAQEVKATLDALGITDFAGYIHDEASDTYGLRYSEFIAPTVKAVQELSAENKALKKRVADLEEMFLQMQGELDALKKAGA